jgi:hypothetical protein
MLQKEGRGEGMIAQLDIGGLLRVFEDDNKLLCDLSAKSSKEATAQLGKIGFKIVRWRKTGFGWQTTLKRRE